ncbi:hypothetical protein ABK040_013746 [Willaertia magna]
MTSHPPPPPSSISSSNQGITTSFSYKIDLWDKYTEIITKLTVNKKDIKQYQSLFKEHSSLYESLGKKLIKTKFATEQNSYEIIEPAERTVTAFQTIGNEFITTHKNLIDELYKEITKLRKELSSAIKLANKEEKKLRSEFNNAKSEAASAKQKDAEEKKHLEDLQIQLFTSDDKNLPPKKLDKLNKEINTYEKKSKKAEEEYENAIKRLHEMDQKYYVQLGLIMHNLESLDRKRIMEMKNILVKFSRLHIQLGRLIQTQSEYMEQGFNDINEEKEIQTFISNNKSGQTPPAPDNFEPYVIRIPDEINKKRFSVISGSNLSSSSLSSLQSSHSTSQAPTTPNNVLLSPPSFTTGSNANNVVNPPNIPPVPTAVTVQSNSVPTAPPVVVENQANSKPLFVAAALYNYDATDESELTIQEGEQLEVLECHDDGWWYGKNSRGQCGLFPSNFVSSETSTAPTHNDTEPPQVSKATALYDYDAQDDSELTFKAGDVISVLATSGDGWFLGELPNGQRGLFPSNFTDCK